ncbi:hypothetical protein [Methanospirillum lacunae]|uniref:hypothetical protein n=1 Tax=Methanospirillum lacunae TaxID=668570 RepID=UPI0015E865BD|nr:hypothetical protein [Methanospirillum lacunae]
MMPFSMFGVNTKSSGKESSRAYYYRNRNQILQRRREKRFLGFCVPEAAIA